MEASVTLVSLRGLRWHRVLATLASTRVSPKTTDHPFSVLQAIVKRVTDLCGPAPSGSRLFFHLHHWRHSYKLEEKRRFELEVIVCGAGQDYAARWANALVAYFAPGGGGFNFEVVEPPAVDSRCMADLEAEHPDLPAAGELCLEFLSPVPFAPASPKQRQKITEAGFVSLLTDRFEKLFGVPCSYERGDDVWRVLPCYWQFVAISDPSASQPGSATPVKGCVGKVYLKGRFGGLLPFLLLGSELHAGAEWTHSRGYYRLHPIPPPFFAPVFPNRWALASACRDVLERYDSAAAVLAQSPGERFDEEEFAARLEEEIRTGAYTPVPSVAFSVRKRDGTERLVEQPHLRDLVVEQYLLRTLGAVFDLLFEEASMGYRKGRSREKAAERIRQAIDDGYRYVVESDVSDFYPSVLLDRMEQLLDLYLPAADVCVRQTMRKILWNGYVLEGRFVRRTRGLAQGNPLSPLLANLYLDAFDEEIQKRDVRLVRYADDFVILTRTREAAEAILCETRECLAEWGLAVNQAKTAIKPAEEGFEFLGFRFRGSELEVETEEEVRRHKKPLYVVEPYLFLGVSGDAVEVRRGSQVVESIPLRRVSEIMVLGQASFSTALVARCVTAGIPVTLATSTGYYMTTVKPDSKRYYDVSARHSQRFNELSDTERLMYAKEFAANKILNYRTLFRQLYEKGTHVFLAELENLADRVREAASVEEVRGYEGVAASGSYERLNDRIPDEAFRLRRRKPRVHPDRMNSLLDFGYYLLFSRINATVRALGLNPYLGFLHSDRDRYESLVCDIEELFRPRVDRLILRLLNWKTIVPGDFTETERGWYMTKDASRKYVQHFEGEMARKERRNDLSLGESIYGQVQVLKRWVTQGESLTFYEWDR